MVRTDYAKALFDVCLENNCLEEVKSDYDVFAKALKEKGNGKFFRIIKSYTLTNERKKRIIDSILKDKCNLYFLYYIYTLIDNKRFTYIFRNKIVFDKLYLESKNIIPFDVFSPSLLTEEQIKSLSSVLKEKFQAKQIIINNFIDKSLVAGIKIKSYEKYYDISLTKQLNDLEILLKRF